jgi:hypothetical protein
MFALAGAIAWREADGLRDQPVFREDGDANFDELRRWLETEGRDIDVLWTDSNTARILPLYTRSPTGAAVWSGAIRSFDDDGELLDEGDIDEGAVVLYSPGYSLVPMAWEDIPRGIRSRDPALIVEDRSLRVVVLD